MQKGLVTVVVPNYNYAHFVREAIDSVLAQTYPHLEIIVVDDGSSDGSREVLENYGERIRTIFQDNSGVSAARNSGAAVGDGEFIAFLDADDSWLPTKIEKQVARFTEDPNLGLVHVGVDEIDADGDSLLQRLEGSDGDATPDLLSLGRKGVLGGGSGLIVPRRIFDEVGGFDTRLSTSADWDLFFQIASRYPVGFVPEILLKYRVHNSNMHGNVRVMEHDMLLAFEKAFANARPDVAGLKRQAYGNLHQTLAGSYFAAGDYALFAKHSIGSLANNPRNIAKFLRFGRRPANRRGVRID